MPHLVVTPFDKERLDALAERGELCTMRAVREDRHPLELLGVRDGEGEFFLEIKDRGEDWLIRADKITRPLDSNRIKKVLGELAERVGMEVRRSNIRLAPGKAPVAAEFDKSIEAFETAEFPFEKVALEVGFGSGRHLLWQAERHPDTLFIGIEIHTPSAQQVLRQIEIRRLKNIWVVNYDARLLLEMLPSNRLEAIYVHFPVPWDKKPHRRVISDSFVAEALRALRPGGLLELRTDSERYYRYSLEVFSRPVRADFRVEKNRDLPVVSKYEARWRRQEKDIYTLTMRSLEASPERKNDYRFTFGGTVDPERIAALPREATVGEGWFVHFGPRYRRVDGRGGVMELSFGSFDRPEHKYLRWDEEGRLEYFPGRPVRTAANHAAHQHIGALIHG
jgi:tRNA (guanine-N7-)-methyltransferase